MRSKTAIKRSSTEVGPVRTRGMLVREVKRLLVSAVRTSHTTEHYAS
jgi:hypothetical protein